MERWEKEPLLFAKQVPVLAFMETVPSWCNETGLADATVVLDAEALDVRWQWFPTDTGVNTRARRDVWSYPVFACDQSANLARTECVKWRGEGTAIISDCGPRSANTCWSSNAGSCCQWEAHWWMIQCVYINGQQQLSGVNLGKCNMYINMDSFFVCLWVSGLPIPPVRFFIWLI